MSDTKTQTQYNYRIKALERCYKRIQVLQEQINKQEEFFDKFEKKNFVTPDTLEVKYIKYTSLHKIILERQLFKELAYKDKLTEEINQATC